MRVHFRKKAKPINLEHKYNEWHAQHDLAEGTKGHDGPSGIWYEMVKRKVGPLTGLAVAEIGCGRGDFSIWLAGQGAKVTAIDFSPSAIEVARSRALSQNIAVNFVVSDAQDNGLPSNSFDLVISCECMEHVPDPQEMSNELYRITRPGGRCILTTPSYLNATLLGWFMSWVRSRPYDSGAGVQPHENLFFSIVVKRMLRKSGFSISSSQSRCFQFLLLPRVSPEKFRVIEFRHQFLNYLLKPFGLHFLYELRK